MHTAQSVCDTPKMAASVYDGKENFKHNGGE